MQGFMAKPCTPHPITRKGYATSVRQQSCQRLCNPQAEQLFKIETANVRGRGGRPLVLSLGGLKGGYSLSEKENIPLSRVPTRCGARSSAAALHPPLRPTGAKRNSPRGLLSSRARGAKVVQIVDMGYLSPFPLFFLWIICSIDFWRFRG